MNNQIRRHELIVALMRHVRRWIPGDITLNGLHVSSYAAMRSHQGNPATLAEIARHCEVSRSSSKRHLDRMLELGIMVRERHPDDGRSWCYRTSDVWLVGQEEALRQATWESYVEPVIKAYAARLRAKQKKSRQT